MILIIIQGIKEEEGKWSLSGIEQLEGEGFDYEEKISDVLDSISYDKEDADVAICGGLAHIGQPAALVLDDEKANLLIPLHELQMEGSEKQIQGLKPESADKEDEVYLYEEIKKASNRMNDTGEIMTGGGGYIVLSEETNQNNEGAIYMKKKVIISVLCGAIVLALSVVWLRGRNVKVFESLDVSALSKISVYLGGREHAFTEREELEKIVTVFQSMRLNKKVFRVNRDGGLSIDLYCQSGEERWMVMFSDCIVLDGDYYTCDRDYCGDIRTLCEERGSEITADLGKYLSGELDADKVRKVTVGTGSGGLAEKEKELSEEEFLQFCEIIRKVKVVKEVPPQVIVGQMIRCEIVREDGSGLVIQEASPYLIIDDVWYEAEDEFCQELDQFAHRLCDE